MTIAQGSKVSMHYKLTVDGKQVDSSEGRDPLTFTFGNGEMIPGLEEQIRGMGTGEKKSFTVTPEKGYGQRRDEAMQTVPKKSFKDLDGLKVGSIVAIHAPQGGYFQATVTNIAGEDVTLDLNHPLAGKTLNFEVEITEVGEAPSPIIKPGE
jgi:FKBP-type peptidyl-prolyl cis-trans isomerase SlyD